MYIEETKIVLPGLKKTYVFFQISDAHIAYAAPNDSEQDRAMACRQSDACSYAGKTPIQALSEIIDYVNQAEGDALLVAGDFADYYSVRNIEYLSGVIAKCNKEVLYVCGNHDCMIYEGTRDHFAYRSHYSVLMQGNPACWVKDYGDLLVVGIDDASRQIDDAQLDFLREQMARGIPILLLTHIPVWTESNDAPILEHWPRSGHAHFSIGKEKTPEKTMEFVNLVKAPASPVAAIIAGHIHFSHVGEFAPGKLQLISAPAPEGFVRRIIVCGT